MKSQVRIWICLIAVNGLALFLVNSCTKDDNPFSMTDADGNVYTSVTIGTQVWMVENLKTTKFCNGDLIGTTNPPTLDIQTPYPSKPKYQWAYNGNESNVATYGRLYTWYAATDSRGVCPTGWHVPTDAEWHTLILNLDANAQPYGIESSIAGGKLKEAGTTHWSAPNEGATNSSGFTAIPGGFRGYQGMFDQIDLLGYWWSSTEFSSDPFYRYLIYDSSYVKRYSTYTHNGFSIRCLKDN